VRYRPSASGGAGAQRPARRSWHTPLTRPAAQGHENPRHTLTRALARQPWACPALTSGQRCASTVVDTLGEHDGIAPFIPGIPPGRVSQRLPAWPLRYPGRPRRQHRAFADHRRHPGAVRLPLLYPTGRPAAASPAVSERLVAVVERKLLIDLVSSLLSGKLRYLLGELAALPARPSWPGTLLSDLQTALGATGTGRRRARRIASPLVHRSDRFLRDPATRRGVGLPLPRGRPQLGQHRTRSRRAPRHRPRTPPPRHMAAWRAAHGQ
jgi:hypothetical protein